MKPTADGTFKVAGAPLDQYVLEMDNGAKAICRTFGGNAFTYITKDGIEVMGKRKDAVDVKSDSKPYAGGAPHCFPQVQHNEFYYYLYVRNLNLHPNQFGPGALMQHGFARGMKFIPEERAKKLSFDRMIFKLEPTEETLKVWHHDFEYRFDITLRADCLEWDVIIMNKGDAPFDVTMGLHNYFDISSLKNVVVSGPFSGLATVDKTSGATGTASSNDIKVTAPIDMLYKGVKGPVTITDSGKGTKTTVEMKGYSDIVVWSPFGDENMGYDKFICVEPVSSTPVTIPVGKFKETKVS